MDMSTTQFLEQKNIINDSRSTISPREQGVPNLLMGCISRTTFLKCLEHSMHSSVETLCLFYPKCLPNSSSLLLLHLCPSDLTHTAAPLEMPFTPPLPHIPSQLTPLTTNSNAPLLRFSTDGTDN